MRDIHLGIQRSSANSMLAFENIIADLRALRLQHPFQATAKANLHCPGDPPLPTMVWEAV